MDEKKDNGLMLHPNLTFLVVVRDVEFSADEFEAKTLPNTDNLVFIEPPTDKDFDLIRERLAESELADTIKCTFAAGVDLMRSQGDDVKMGISHLFPFDEPMEY